MASLTALQVRDLLVEATSGDNRKTIEATPALAWQLAELDARIAQLDGTLGGRGLDETLTRLQTNATDCDLDHDEVRRFLFKLMDAATGYGSAVSRAAIARALTSLYPDGLEGLQASYRDEVAAAPDFAQRLERPEVVAGLDALAEHIKGVKDLVRDCVRTGERLTEAMRALDAAEVEASAKTGGRALFAARNAALKSWSTFVTVAEHALAGDQPQREKLLHRWRSFQQQARTRSTAPATTPDPVAPPIEADLPA